MAELSSELKAMAQIESALKDLDPEVQQRIMQWALARFNVSMPNPSKRKVDGGGALKSEDGEERSYADFADFYDAASPSTDAEKAIVASYWFQVQGGASDVEAQGINKALKDLGHAVGNITRAFESLKAMKPALMIQTKKDGTTQQARKRYKVTAEGKKAVERMLTRVEN